MNRSTGNANRDVWAPALLVLCAAMLAVALRPPIPPDETRYCEVLREMHVGGPWLLRLNGVPYAQKAPMLFWIGALLHAFGLPLAIGLRIIPGIASAATVVITAHLGRRIGAPLAGWVQALMLAPAVYAQALYFDPLLTLCVWTAIASWSRGRDVWASVAAAAAFLTKGPVAALSLVPLAWAAKPLRQAREPWAGRLAVITVAAVLPLAAWAMYAASIGGESFAHELLWKQTADRIATASSHAQPFWFYAAIFLAGTLPCTPLLFVRSARPASSRSFERRLPFAIIAVVLVMSCFPSKLPHYVLPLFPALALMLAERLQARERASRAVQVWAAAFLFALTLACAGIYFARSSLLMNYGQYSDELIGDRRWLALAFSAWGTSAVCIVYLSTAWRSARSVLFVALTAQAVWFLPIHAAIGRLWLPRAIEARLRAEAQARLLIYGNQQAGLFNWLSDRDAIDCVRTLDDAERWCADHPGGWLLAEDEATAGFERLHLEPLVHDLVHGTPSTLFVVRPSTVLDADR